MPKKRMDVLEANGKPVDGMVIITPKREVDWMALFAKTAKDHWRTIMVTIRIRERLYAGKPAKLDAAEAMIKARGLEDVLEAKLAEVTDPAERAARAEEVKNEGLCEFYRRPGKEGIWLPSNQIKAMLKENWSVLGLRKAIIGSRGALAEGVFVFDANSGDKEWIYLGAQPDGVETKVCHTTGPSGPLSSIKRHEYVERPTIRFVIQISNAKAVADKLPNEAIARTLLHAQEHGLGANRSQQAGTFDVLAIEELDTW